MSEADEDERPKIIRLCVDLNVWIRYLLGVRRGVVRASGSSTILNAVKTGQSNAGPVQLVISHTMLSRLEDVLVRLQFQPGDASAFCSLLRAFSDRGPHGVPPYIILGGGTSPSAESRMPMYDAYNPLSIPSRSDDEDGRVLDTAIAGRADILATYNFDDFQTPSTDLLERGQLQIYRAAHHSIMIAHAQRVAEFMTTGQYPSPRSRPGGHRKK
jgi:predicted nucleic acid-binding protein